MLLTVIVDRLELASRAQGRGRLHSRPTNQLDRIALLMISVELFLGPIGHHVALEMAVVAIGFCFRGASALRPRRAPADRFATRFIDGEEIEPVDHDAGNFIRGGHDSRCRWAEQ